VTTGSPATDPQVYTAASEIPDRRNDVRGIAGILVLVIVFWGFNWPLLKTALGSIGPLTLASVRLLLGAAVLFVFLIGRRSLGTPTRRDLPIVLSVGILQMGVFIACINLGLQYVEAGRSSILAYTTPLWVLPGAALFLREPVGRTHLLGFLLGIAGVVVLFSPMSFDWTDRSVVVGNALLLLAAFAWAAQIVHVRGHDWDSTPLQLAPWQMLVGFACIAPLALMFERDVPIDATPVLIAIVIYNGVIATAFGMWAVVTVNRALPAATTSIVLLGVPVSGLIFSFLLLGEPLSGPKLVGLSLILAGVGVVSTTMARTGAQPNVRSVAVLPLD
jgi:drug/metabolite transporter (DMT)-like permease